MRRKRETGPSTDLKETKKAVSSKRWKLDLNSQIQNLQILLREKDEEISKLQAIINSTIQEKDEIIATLKEQLEAVLNQKKLVETSNPVKKSPAESPHNKNYKLVPYQRLRKIPKSRTTIQKPAKSIVVQQRKSLRANLSTVGSLEYRASSGLPQAVSVSNLNEKYLNDSLDLDTPELRGSYKIFSPPLEFADEFGQEIDNLMQEEIKNRGQQEMKNPPGAMIKDRTEFNLHEDLDKTKDDLQRDLDITKDDIKKDMDSTDVNLIEDLNKTKDDLQNNLDRTKDDLWKDLDKTEDDIQKDLDRTENDIQKDPDRTEDNIKKDLDGTEDNIKKDLDRTEDDLIEDLNRTDDDIKKDLDKTEDNIKKDLDGTEDNIKKDLDRTEDNINEDPDYDVDDPEPLQQDAENVTKKGKVKSGKILKQNQCRIRRSQCPVCLAKFRTKASKKEHFERTGHCFRFSCDQCGNFFKQKIELTRHIRQKHSSDLPFSCSRCDKKFKNAFSMKRHEKNDLLHRKKPYLECEYCSKRYPSKRKALFSRHLDIHLGKTSVPCEICGKVFVSDDYLIVHSKICGGQLEFQCTYCPRRFGYKATLITHTRMHTQEKPFSCISCSSSFRTRPLFNKHWKRVHGVKEEPDMKDPDSLLPVPKAEEEFELKIEML